MDNLWQKTLDILLIMAPSWGSNMPPLGLYYVNSSLLAKGYKTDLFDMNIDLFSKVKERYKELWNFEKHPLWVDPNEFSYIKDVFCSYIEDYSNYLLEINPVVLAFSVNAGNRLFTLELLKRIRRRGEGLPFILIGGPLSRMDRNHQFILSDFTDYIDSAVIGEGEEITGNIIDKIKSAQYSQINKFIQAEQIQDLDSLPFPLYKREDLNKYTEDIIPLLMSRGCLGRCSFCDARFFQPGFRIRSPENVLEEIKHHINITGIKNFTFNDLAINWDLDKLERLCDLIIENRLDIIWNASATIRTGMSSRLFRKMEKAGCSSRGKDKIFGVRGGSLVFGLESGSVNTLKTMNKYYTPDVAADVLCSSAQAGINNIVNIIVGFPGEKEIHLLETIDFVKKNQQNISKVGTFSLAYVPAYSELGQNPDKFGIELPADDPIYKWYTRDGNNFQERKGRAKKLESILNDINLAPLATTSNYEQKSNKAGGKKQKNSSDSHKGVILVASPPWEVIAPPLGVAYLESYLNTHNIQTRILDANLISYFAVSEYARKLWNYEYIDKWNDESFFYKIREKELKGIIGKVKKMIYKMDVPLIGFSVNQVNRLFVKELVKGIKNDDCEKKIILGGPGVFHQCERESLSDIKDLVYAWVVGEGENPLYQLVSDYYSGESKKYIPGVIWKGEDISFSRTQPPENLDEIPFPKYRGFDLNCYTEKDIVKILGSRGCIGKCKFCNDRVFMAPYRSRSAENVFEEIKFHYYNLSKRHFVFNDLLFNGNVSTTEELLDLIISSGMDIRWDANVVLSKKLFPDRLIGKFLQSGCNILMVGIESGSENIIKKMGKLFNFEEATLLLRKLHDSGIKIWINLIVGHPGETEADFDQTIKFLLENKMYINQVSSLNTCNIPFGSLLMEEKEYYGIHFSEDRGVEVDWWDEKGNNRELRDQRLEKIKRVLHENHIDCMQSNEVCFRNNQHNFSKKSDILLIMPPPWGVDVPPLSVACLSSHLRKQGFSVRVFDFNIELYNLAPEKFKYLWSMNYGDWWHDEDKYKNIRKYLGPYIELLLDKIVNFPERVVGFSLPTNCPDLIVSEIVRKIKRISPDKIIILGGVSISIKEQRNNLLAKIGDLVDYCIVGEGEEALCALVKKISLGKLESIKNFNRVLYRDDFDVKIGKASVKDWNQIAFPKFEGFDLRKYTAQGKSLPIEFSRGCVSNCPFCDFRSIAPTLKTKKASVVLEQVRFYLDKYGINHLTIVDPSVNSSISNLNDICNLLIDSRIDIRLSALAIPRQEMTYPLLLKMNKAGFYRLEYGLESGSNKILKGMRKIFTAEVAQQVLRDTCRAGIKAFVYLIVGYPGETMEEFQQTKRFLDRNKDYITMIKSINPLYIMAGSEMFYNYQKYNITLSEKDSDRKWYIGNKNTYDVRTERVFKLKKEVRKLGIPFTEEAESLEFTTVGETVKPNQFRKQRNIIQWVQLFFVALYTLFYINYFWLYMIVKDKMLLGGITQKGSKGKG